MNPCRIISKLFVFKTQNYLQVLLPIMPFFLLRYQKRIFFLIYVVWPTESKSDVYFQGQNRNPSIIQKKFRIICGFQCRPTKTDTWFGFYWSRLKKIVVVVVVYHQSGKFPLSQKFRVNNSKCHSITVRSKWWKTFNMEFFLLKLVYFDMQNSNPMSIFVGRDRKTSIIRMNIFPDWEYRIRR